MSLDYNLTKLPERLWKNEKEWPITSALIWLTLLIGIGEITEKNWIEVAARIAFYERIHGSYLVSNGQPRPFQAEWVQLRIGLRTNVSFMTKTKFIKHHGEGLLREETQRVGKEAQAWAVPS